MDAIIAGAFGLGGVVLGALLQILLEYERMRWAEGRETRLKFFADRVQTDEVMNLVRYERLWHRRQPWRQGQPNLSRGKFRGVDLSRQDLSGVNFYRANLADAKFDDAKLCRADMTGAHLPRATFIGADLTRANLTGADLADANLTGATVTDEQLATAKTLKGATLRDGTKHE